MAFKLFDRVQESTTSTGTGNLSLGGAITGFSTFASRYSTGDTLYYAVHAVDASGVPTGEWEVGLGTYSAASTLTRTTVMASSNSDAAVNFSVGTKRVFVTMTALQGGSIRERLTAARTYYVRSDGSDSNDGLSNTSGGAFLTIQKAVDVVCALDMSIYQVTINCGDATRTEKVTLKTYLGSLAPSIVGNTTTPANCTINATSGNCFTNQSTRSWDISGFKLTTTTSGNALSANGGGSVITFSIIDFGACANHQRSAQNYGKTTAVGNYTISGSAQTHYLCNSFGSHLTASKTVTLTGTPNFSVAYAYANSPGLIEDYSNTFSGSATGKRYSNSANSVIFTNGGGASYLPGDTAGDTPTTGGQYT